MIRFFPMPYPDESIYSIFAQYDEDSGNEGYTVTIRDLVGKIHSSITFTFASGLDFLCKQLPETSLYTPEYFINNHTLLPLYKPFIPKKRYTNAIKNLKNGNLSSVLAGIGATAGTNCKSIGIKYCGECIADDKKYGGRAYLHRSHQVNGNYVCDKHNTYLRVFEPPKRKVFYNVRNMDLKDEYLSSTKPSEESLNLAKDINFVLLNHEKFESYEITREKYFSKLFEIGYFSNRGYVEQVRLNKNFLNFYTIDFLASLNSIVNPYDINNWIRSLSHGRMVTVNPIRNLLFIRFLFGGINEFMNYKYHKLSGFKDYKSGNNDNINKSIKAFRIKLKEPYQKIILNVIKNEPNINRQKIRIRYKKEFRWLEKHEKEWLESILPAPYAHKEFFSGNNSYVNWELRDLETYEVAKNAIFHIFNNDLMERVTIYHISEKIKYQALYRDYHKMPRTKELFESYLEDMASYHKRKIRIAYKILTNQQKDKIKPYMITQLARMNSSYEHDYDAYIEDLLKE